MTINSATSLILNVSNCILDSADLYLNGTKDSGEAAKLVLNASDIVSNLWIDGFQQIAGNYDNTETWISGAGILTVLGDPPPIPPTLSSNDIVDDTFGDTIYEDYTQITYTVIFSDDMDDTTVDSNDFSNAGTALINIGDVTEFTFGQFYVNVYPYSTGSLILQVPAGAVLLDNTGVPLDTTNPIPDVETITILPGNTPTSVMTNNVGGNNSWNNADNWSNGVPFGPATAVIAVGVAAQVYNAPPDYWGDLILSNNASLVVAHPDGKPAVPPISSAVTCYDGTSIRAGNPEHLSFGDMVLEGGFTLWHSGNPAHHEQPRIYGTVSGPGSFTYVGCNGVDTFMYGTNTFSGGFHTADGGGSHWLYVYATNAFGAGDVTFSNNCNVIINNSNTMDNISTLNIYGTGSIATDHDDLIGFLYVDGVRQPDGQYTSSSSWLSGTGIITVLDPRSRGSIFSVY